jgi:hypothetical protein
MTMMTSDASVKPIRCPDEIMVPFNRAVSSGTRARAARAGSAAGFPAAQPAEHPGIGEADRPRGRLHGRAVPDQVLGT